MAKSQLFYTDQYATTQKKIKEFLNVQDQFLSGSTAKSTRAVGDAIQDILSDNFQSILGSELCAKRIMVSADNGVSSFFWLLEPQKYELTPLFLLFP